MRIFIILLLLVVMFFSNVFADQVREIVLSDGSVLYGNVIGIINGKYRIDADNLGVIEVDEDKIVSIRKKPESSGVTQRDISNLEITPSEPTDSKTIKAGIDALKRSISNDAGTMERIGNLQNDPDFMAAINDPEIMSAVASGDVNALTSNPKFMKLLNHPVVRGVENKVK